MKRPTYLYVLLTLSSIGVLWSLFSSFTGSPQVATTGNVDVDAANASLLPVAQASFNFSHSLLYHLALVIGLGLIIAAWYFLLKQKDQIKANITYIAYQILKLLLGLGATIVSNNALGAVTGQFKAAAAIGVKFSGVLQLILFLIFVSVPVFKLFRLQKEAEKEA